VDRKRVFHLFRRSRIRCLQGKSEGVAALQLIREQLVRRRMPKQEKIADNEGAALDGLISDV